ncbi:MAG: hypothetical protein ACP5VF_07460 [Acidobacteriota bacterium]
MNTRCTRLLAIVALALLTVLAACSNKKFGTAQAERCLRDCLKGYSVQNLTITSIQRSQAGDSYQVTASFQVPYNGKTVEFKNQLFLITYDQPAHEWRTLNGPADNPMRGHIWRGDIRKLSKEDPDLLKKN